VSLKAEELVLDLMGEDARAGSCTSRDSSSHENFIFFPQHLRIRTFVRIDYVRWLRIL
jgi:hypothetical protein